MLVGRMATVEDRLFWRHVRAVVEWVAKLEAKSG